MITAAEKIKIIARRKGITQKELAAAFGISRQAFNMKLHRNSFSPPELERVADLLGCSVDLVFTDRTTGEKF